MTGIMKASDARKVTGEKLESREVKILRGQVASEIARASDNGKYEVIIEDVLWLEDKLKSAYDIIRHELISKGYSVSAYRGEDTEYTCFGASKVAVHGVRISWGIS